MWRYSNNILLYLLCTCRAVTSYTDKPCQKILAGRRTSGLRDQAVHEPWLKPQFPKLRRCFRGLLGNKVRPRTRNCPVDNSMVHPIHPQVKSHNFDNDRKDQFNTVTPPPEKQQRQQ